ncbi:UNVERIFIED_CONTAM: hypothetical protein Sradi_4564700 [Sesamum radiatum]|uniref:Uncharacterized protein n=1 Tax=Sesamum radiatum TaxID=300843 RepID=A0AAW2NC79_SESRA
MATSAVVFDTDGSRSSGCCSSAVSSSTDEDKPLRSGVDMSTWPPVFFLEEKIMAN